VSQGTLIGIDQLVLGATAACDLLDLEGNVAIATGTPITPQLLFRIKEAGIVGLVAGRPDYVSHHFTSRRPSIEIIASRISEMQRRSGIACPLTGSTLDLSRKILTDSFNVIVDNRLPDLKVLDELTGRIIHDIELVETPPLPYPRRDNEKSMDRVVDSAIDMTILMAWYLKKQGVDPGFVHEASLGALLHDIGLLHISQNLLDRDRTLTVPEYREVQRHPYLGVRALSPLGDNLPKIARDVILLHHEREDGNGYPLKRSGETIPEIARFAHIIDVFIALVSPRPHRDAYTPHKAIEMLLRDAGKGFNREALRRFVETTGRYPLGSAVMLSSNEVGVVVGQGKGGPFRPVVDIYFTKNHQFSSTARRVDLAGEHFKYVKQVMK
jgi:hypothetical protein